GLTGMAVLTSGAHGGFLSDACEVSCRVRAGAARPPGEGTATPQAGPERRAVVRRLGRTTGVSWDMCPLRRRRVGGFPGSPAPAVRECRWMWVPGWRQDSAIRPSRARTYARAHVGNKYWIHTYPVLTLLRALRSL